MPNGPLKLRPTIHLRFRSFSPQMFPSISLLCLSQARMIIIALITVIVIMSGTPVWAQDTNSGYQNFGNIQFAQNPNNLAPGTIQSFQGLNNPTNFPGNGIRQYSPTSYPQANFQQSDQNSNYSSGIGPQTYATSNYPAANGMQPPSGGQSYGPTGTAQFYQNPNYPLQGSMRIDRSAPYGSPQ